MIFNQLILSFSDRLDDAAFQLDKALDCHVSRIKDDISFNSDKIQSPCIAGRGQVLTASCGNLIFLSIENKTEIFYGARYTPRQKNSIPSTVQQEKQDFSIKRRSNNGNIEVIRSNGKTCVVVRRVSGRLLFKPPYFI